MVAESMVWRDSRRRIVLGFSAALIVVAAAFFLGLAQSPGLRVQVFGEWGYRHLVDLDTKVKWVNEHWDDWGVGLGLGGGSTLLKYSRDVVSLMGVDPVCLGVFDLDKGSFSGATPLRQLEDGTFVLDSSQYPIRIYLTVVEQWDVGNGPHIRALVRAERAP